MAMREGRWDCPSCGTVGNLGRQVGCPHCGMPRPEDIRFYLPEDAPELTDAALLAQARAGADWVCEHCGASARAAEDDCPGCGAPRGSSPAQEVREYDLDEIPTSGKAPPRTLAAPAAPPRPRRKFPAGWLLLALIAAAFWWFNAPRTVEGEVAGMTWERSLEVEAYRTVREEGWDVPSGGRTVRSFRAVRDWRQVLDHYETRQRQVSERVQTGTESYTCGSVDRGNGYFEDRTCTRPVYTTHYRTETYQEPVYRKEPIYATKYAYDIEKWVTDTVLRAAGAADARDERAAPAWPEPRLGKNRREGERTQKYVLQFRDADGETYQREVPASLFAGYQVGEPVKLRVTRAGSVQILGPDGEPLTQK